MSKRNIIILISIAAFIGCKEQNKSNKKVNTIEVERLVVKDIRTDTTNSWNSIHNIRQLSKQLKLESVETGFDSLQIRIWFDYSLAKKKHLLILERKKTGWVGKLFEINVRYIDTLNYNVIEGYTKKSIEPISGWQELINNLSELKIDELYDSSQMGADGTTYCVEILTRDKYVYYSFWEPQYTKDSNWQASNMTKIVSILKREFNLVELKK